MTSTTHLDAPTQRVRVGANTIAYRRFGRTGGTPIVFLQHFRGGLDHWDPAVTDGLAAHADVILVDNTGVAGSSGATPDTIEAMADDIAHFLDAIGVAHVHALGFSMGGYVAQTLAQRHAQRVHRLVLVGTGPRNGDPPTDPRVMQFATRPENTEADFLFLFFHPSASSQHAGRAFWARRHARTHDVDPPSSLQTMQAQIKSFAAWRESPGPRFAYLREIPHPTLVVNGSDDVMIPTGNSFHLARHLPRAQLIVYPNAGHAPHFQYPALFTQHVLAFLDERLTAF